MTGARLLSLLMLTCSRCAPSSSWARATTCGCPGAPCRSAPPTAPPSATSPSTGSSCRSSSTQVGDTAADKRDDDADLCRQVRDDESVRRRGRAQHRDAAALHRQGDGARPRQLHHRSRHGRVTVAIVRGQIWENICKISQGIYRYTKKINVT